VVDGAALEKRFPILSGRGFESHPLRQSYSAMRKIVALGGGEIGRQGYPVETTSIDMETVHLSGKKHPKLLFIPTASSDPEEYFKVVKEHFSRRIGCETDVLYLVREKPGLKEIENKILSSDVVYVGGGNTLMMMQIWRQLGVDKVLRQAYERGIVLSGLSAGAICWFRWGHSDSKKFTDPDARFKKVTGLGFINALYCPHYDVEKDRKPSLKKLMEKVPGVALALDNCCAIEIIDDRYKIICSKPSANAYKVYWSKGSYFEEIIEKRKEFRPLSGLLMKQAK
jgi:dipeptidase E